MRRTLTLKAALLSCAVFLATAQAADSGGAYAGLAVRTTLPTERQLLPPLQGAGLTVREIASESPAASADIVANDILTLWDDQRLFTPGQLHALVLGLTPGQSHTLTLYRDGEPRTVDLVLAARPTASATNEIPAVLVPSSRWYEDPDFLEELTTLLATPAATILTTNGSPETLPPGWDQQADWIVILQSENAASTTNANDSANVPAPAPPEPLLESSTLVIEEAWGSIELEDHRGSPHVTVRNRQGSILYRGTLNSEADRMSLRPLRPEIREAVEALIDTGLAPAPTGDLRLRKLTPPPKFI